MATETRKPKYPKRFALLAAAIVAAVGLYTAGWYYLAGRLQDEAAMAIAAANRDGVRAACENETVKGYPFRVGLACDSVLYENAQSGISISAGAFRSAAQVYDPAFIVSELDGKARVELPDIPPLTLDWDNLRSSIRLAEPLPERTSIEIRNLAALIAGADGSGLPFLSAERAEAHMRPNGTDLDLAVSTQKLLPDPALLQGRNLPPLDTGFNLTIDNGVALIVSSRQSLRGISGTLRQAYLAPSPEAAVGISGSFHVDDAGLLNAELAVTAKKPDELAAVLKELLPEAKREIEMVATGLKSMGDQQLPIRIAKGKVFFTFFEIGEIPPLP